MSSDDLIALVPSLCHLLNKTQLDAFEISTWRWILASTALPLPCLRLSSLKLLRRIHECRLSTTTGTSSFKEKMLLHNNNNSTSDKETKATATTTRTTQDGLRIVHAQSLALSLTLTYDFKQHGTFGRLVRLFRKCRDSNDDVPVDRLVSEIMEQSRMHDLEKHILKVVKSENDEVMTMVKTLCDDLCENVNDFDDLYWSHHGDADTIRDSDAVCCEVLKHLLSLVSFRCARLKWDSSVGMFPVDDTSRLCLSVAMTYLRSGT